MESCVEGKGPGWELMGVRWALAGHSKDFSQNEETFNYKPIF